MSDVRKRSMPLFLMFQGESVDPITQKDLNDENWEKRFKMVVILGKSKDIRAIGPLINAIQDVNDDVRSVAIDALAKIGDSRAVQPILNSLSDESWSVRVSAVEALEKLGDQSIVDKLLPYLNDDNILVKKAVIKFLNKFDRKPETITEKVNYFLTESSGDSSYNWDGLIQLGDPAVDELINILNKSDYEVKKNAMIALGKIKNPRAINPLIKELTLGSGDFVGYAYTALENIKIGVTEALIKELRTKTDTEIKNKAVVIRLLCGLEDRQTINPLISEILIKELYRKEEISLEHTKEIIRLLGERGDKKAIVPLIRAAKNDKSLIFSVKTALTSLGVDLRIITCVKCKNDFNMQTDGEAYVQREPWPTRLFCPHCGFLVAYYTDTERSGSYNYGYWRWYKDNEELNFYRYFPDTDPRFVYFRNFVPSVAFIEPGKDQIDMNLIRQINPDEKNPIEIDNKKGIGFFNKLLGKKEKNQVNNDTGNGPLNIEPDYTILSLKNQLLNPGYETFMATANKFGELARISPEKITPVIPLFIKDLYSQEDRIKRGGREDRIASGSAMALSSIAEANPSILVPWMDDFIKFLEYTKTEQNYEIIAKRVTVYILGIIGSTKPNIAIPIITQYLDDQDEYVRKNAKEAIQNLGT
jgi:HEAT repeat protein